MTRMPAPPAEPVSDPTGATVSGFAAGPVDDTSTVVEVATVAADTLRASVRISGPLAGPACSILLCVLGAHLRAGRHYLRVDVSGASGVASEALAALVAMHQQ